MKISKTKRISIIIVIVLTISILNVNFTHFIEGETNLIPSDYHEKINDFRKDLIEVSPILINSDSDFISYGFPGDGSEINPYVIANYSIVTSNSYCINIKWTTKHFVIKNCYIDSNGWGIELNDLADNTLIVTDNYVVNNQYDGIALGNSKGAIITNNTCISNCWGIFLVDCEYISIINNTCNYNEAAGLDIEYSAKLTIENNTAESNGECGINIYNCNSIDIVNNYCSHSTFGINLDAGFFCSIAHNTIRSNEFGIAIDSDVEYTDRDPGKNNIIHHNTFKYNWFAAEDSGENNTWFETSSKEGNNWDDWKGYGYYDIYFNVEERDEVVTIDKYPFLVDLDIDDDNDSLPDTWESKVGLSVSTNNTFGDEDSDGLSNIQEYLARTNPFDENTDNDLLTDGDEVNIYFTDPNTADSDGDRLSDYEEIFIYLTNPNDIDTDSDVMNDYWEILYGLNPLSDDSAEDPDGDNVPNIVEYILDINPLSNDTDLDGLNDYDEIYDYYTSPKYEDSDSDGMIDGFEAEYGLDPLVNDAENDEDQDGITNLMEFLYGTNPLLNDTDSDGFTDFEELRKGTDPTNSEDYPDKEEETTPEMTDFNFLSIVVLLNFLGLLIIILRKRSKFEKY